MPATTTLATIPTAVVGVVHLIAGSAHGFDPVWLAVGFLAVGAVQLLAGVGLLCRWPGARAVAITTHLGALTMWTVSRTVGLPMVASHGVGVADAVAVLLQLAALTFLTVSGIGGQPRRLRRVAAGPGWPTVVAVVLGAALGGAAIADLVDRQDDHAADHGHAAHDDIST